MGAFRGGGHEFIHKWLPVAAAVVIGGGWVAAGGLEEMAHGVNSMATHVIAAVRIMAGSLAVVAVLIGGVIAISPKHRTFGYDMALGGVIVLVVAAFGPTVVKDLQGMGPAPSAAVVVTVPGESAGL